LKKKIETVEETIKADKAKKAGSEKNTQKTKIKDIYLDAYQALKEGRTGEARGKFKSLLNDYSENEYSDNARFWIGESYYKDGSYEDAILAYEELFKKNADSDKVPGAMLKQGLAFYALKEKKTGQLILEKLIEKFPDSEQQLILEKLIEKFPDSEQARLAKKKMKKLVVTKNKD
jgi:tol-pal system protein YbgF